jgi:hypothetical protein
MQLGAAAMVSVPALGVAAPELFYVSSDLAGTKAVLSWTYQAVFNGVQNVDYADVVSDAFTQPGLGALLNGGIDFTPFSRTTTLRIVGWNKGPNQFAIDAGTTLMGGIIGQFTWKLFRPILKGSTEKTIFYFSTQSWINASSQGAAKILIDKNEKK